jgi:hypothetical protein
MLNKRKLIIKRNSFFKKKNEFIRKKWNQYAVKQKMIIQKNSNIIKNQILYPFSDYFYGNNENKERKNTVLLIEPRYFQEIPYLLANAYNKLGNNWNYVFYCGKSFKSIWESILPKFIEIRSLGHDNFNNTRLYSDFLKKKEIWESLYGDFVLTIQMDTWIMNIAPYDINYFIRLNKSFIGGNMDYKWIFFNKVGIHHSYRNFNGGLSLRKRIDMIKIIESFPPIPTKDDYTNFLSEQEDVYFTMGCIKLNLPIGQDEPSSHFSLHTIYHEKYFGIHQPNSTIKKKLQITNKYLKFINPFIG